MYRGERFNAFSHLLGLSIAASFSTALMLRALQRSDHATSAGIALFSLAALTMYASSIAFHSARGKAKVALERIDQSAIFFLIAGSYTPFALSSPRYGLNLIALAIVWLSAARIAWVANVRGLLPNVQSYALLGWFAVAAALPVAWRFGLVTAALLVIGAAVYSGGILFYMNRMRWTHAHGIWHLCVVAGTATHFAAVSQLLA